MIKISTRKIDGQYLVISVYAKTQDELPRQYYGGTDPFVLMGNHCNPGLYLGNWDGDDMWITPGETYDADTMQDKLDHVCASSKNLDRVNKEIRKQWANIYAMELNNEDSAVVFYDGMKG